MPLDALLASLLDAERALLDNDLRYWASRARGRVLDLGCGTGRLISHLRRLAIPVVGLGTDAVLLERAKRNAPGVPVVRADLRRFALRGFGAAFSLFGSLQELLSPRDRALCLSCVRDALPADGVLVLDLERTSSRAASASPRRLAADFPMGGKRVTRFETAQRAGDVISLRSEWLVDGKPAGESVRRLAALDRRAVERELRDAGFELFALFGDWREGRFDERGERMVVEAARV